MSKSNLYFDESGFTGADLTNQEQPIFCLASVCFSDEELAKIRMDIGLDNGREIHFKNMHTNWQGRKILRELYQHPLMNDRHISTAFANKRYCVYAQIVDTVIEVFCYENGYNLYKDKQNLYLANLLYYNAVQHPKQDIIVDYEKTFVKMMRQPCIDTVADFYRKTDALIKDHETKKEFAKLLSFIPPTIKTIKDAIDNDNPFYLDNTLSLFVSLIQVWYNKNGEKSDVFFDDSKPISTRYELITQLRDMDVKSSEVGYGDRKHIYPLPVGNIQLVKSDNYLGVQIADAIASAIVFILNNKKNNLTVFQQELKGMAIFQKSDMSLVPWSAEVLIKDEDDTRDIDPLDFLCQHLC